jgi:hypothetical protein
MVHRWPQSSQKTILITYFVTTTTFFLIRRNYITLNELERITQDALSRARKYDFHPDFLEHLQELKDRVK